MGALLGILIPLVPSLIQGVEKIFSGKPKSGPDKIKAVTDALRQIIERMMAAGVPLPDGSQIPEKSVSDDLLRGMIEAELQRIKADPPLIVNGKNGEKIYVVRESSLTVIR